MPLVPSIYYNLNQITTILHYAGTRGLSDSRTTHGRRWLPRGRGMCAPSLWLPRNAAMHSILDQICIQMLFHFFLHEKYSLTTCRENIRYAMTISLSMLDFLAKFTFFTKLADAITNHKFFQRLYARLRASSWHPSNQNEPKIPLILAWEDIWNKTSVLKWK